MDSTRNEIRKFIDKHIYMLQNIKVILIANVINQTKHKEERSNKNIAIEFFSETEIDEIIQGLRSNGLYVEVYFDEHCFINAVINKKIKDTHNILVFNLTRNGFGIGKKALIPSFCDLFNIKYTGSNAYSVSLARHKYHYSRLLSAMNLCGTPSWLFDKGEWLFDSPPQGLQIILKPVFESASKGISSQSIMNTAQNDFLEKVHIYHARNNQPVICQEFISGYEVEILIIELYSELLALPPIGIKINNHTFIGDSIISEEISRAYDYNFYLSQNILGEELVDKLLSVAKSSFKVLGLNNYARIDFRINKDYKIYITDVSATPYVISHSSFNYVFLQLGFEQKDLFLLIILSALVRLSSM